MQQGCPMTRRVRGPGMRHGRRARWWRACRACSWAGLLEGHASSSVACKDSPSSHQEHEMGVWCLPASPQTACQQKR